MCMYLHEFMSTTCLWVSWEDRGYLIPWIWKTGGCELHNVSAGKCQAISVDYRILQ